MGGREEICEIYCRTEKEGEVERLHSFAAAHEISVEYFTLKRAQSLSMPVRPGYAVAIDPERIESSADEYCKLAHEIGHCQTEAFYNRHTPFDIMEKHENTADKWAIEHTITADELDDAIAEGCGEYWQLAERFGVTEDFMKKTVCWYTYGNLAIDQFL